MKLATYDKIFDSISLFVKALWRAISKFVYLWILFAIGNTILLVGYRYYLGIDEASATGYTLDHILYNLLHNMVNMYQVGFFIATYVFYSISESMKLLRKKLSLEDHIKIRYFWLIFADYLKFRSRNMTKEEVKKLDLWCREHCNHLHLVLSGDYSGYVFFMSKKDMVKFKLSITDIEYVDKD